MSARTRALVFAWLSSCAPSRPPEPTVATTPTPEAAGPVASAAPIELDAGTPPDSARPETAAVDPATPSYKDPLGPADHDFAFRFYATQRSASGNLFMSPASLRVALAMVYAGARGETATEMQRALGFAPDVGATSDYFTSLLKEWNAGGDPKIKLKVVNRLWGDKSVHFAPAFTALLAQRFTAPLERLDFAGSPDASRRKINSWVDHRTEHLIQDLLQPDDVTNLTRIVLTNAIYFKGAWTFPFAKTSTSSGPFHVAPGKDVTAPLMHKSGRFAYAETPAAKFLALQYGGGAMSMVIVLPQENFGLDDLERSLGPAAFDEAVSHMQPAQLEVTLPRFSSTYRASLGKALRQMGMTLVLAKADLSAMADSDLHLSDVIQKAFVKVDETGTEAAAATGAVVALTAARVAHPFVADHPFLYAIRDGAGNLLFLGRLSDPTP